MSTAKVPLAPNLVGLGKPPDEFRIDIGGRRQPKGVHHIAAREFLRFQEPAAASMPGKDKVPAEPANARDEGREAHSDMQCYTGLFR
jgi:hypothetical protein